jgi:hypothetical protein
MIVFLFQNSIVKMQIQFIIEFMQLCICAPNKIAPDHIQNFSGT